LPGPADIAFLRSRACRRAVDAIPQIAAGEGDELDLLTRSHVSECLRCQAEIASYRKMMRGLSSMRDQVIEAPGGSVTSLFEVLDQAADRAEASARWAVRAAYVGGFTAAAGAAGVLVWMSRRRPGYAQAS
jgi:hypothetical protein